MHFFNAWGQPSKAADGGVGGGERQGDSESSYDVVFGDRGAN